MQTELRVWRSLMYVPVNVEKYVDKAHTRGADCIQLDLEDSVQASDKGAARKLVAAAAKRGRRGDQGAEPGSCPRERSVHFKVGSPQRHAGGPHPPHRHDRDARCLLPDA